MIIVLIMMMMMMLLSYGRASHSGSRRSLFLSSQPFVLYSTSARDWVRESIEVSI